MKEKLEKAIKTLLGYCKAKNRWEVDNSLKLYRFF